MVTNNDGGNSADSAMIRPDVPSLTGLRFFAAFFILLNHLTLGFVSRETAYFGRFLANGAFLGMDVFFVLSGFIIHYNYSAKINGSLKSFHAFFVARVSRLYPLFFATFAIDFLLIAHSGGIPWSDMIHAVPFFVTMSQSWFYQLTSAGTALYYMFPRASIAWSVSSEMLMYAFYPLFWYWLLKSRNFSWKMPGVVAVFAVATLSLLFKGLYTSQVGWDKLGVALFGEMASVSRSPEFSFAFWVWYVSPYSRLLQFLCGIVVADYCLKHVDRHCDYSDSTFLRAGQVLTPLYVVASCLPYQNSIPVVGEIYKIFGYTPVVCFCIYCCYANRSGYFSRLLSTNWCVRLGERSYSVYIWHIYFYAAALSLPGTRFLHVVMAWAGIYIFSAISYKWLEKPLRQRMRKLLSWA